MVYYERLSHDTTVLVPREKSGAKRSRTYGLVDPSPFRPSFSRPKVASMNLPWVLGAPNEGDYCVVIQLVGAVLQSGKQALGAGCFALLRWGGRVVGRTPFCHDLHEPSWRDQVCLDSR